MSENKRRVHWHRSKTSAESASGSYSIAEDQSLNAANDSEDQRESALSRDVVVGEETTAFVDDHAEETETEINVNAKTSADSKQSLLPRKSEDSDEDEEVNVQWEAAPNKDSWRFSHSDDDFNDNKNTKQCVPIRIVNSVIIVFCITVFVVGLMVTFYQQAMLQEEKERREKELLLNLTYSRYAEQIQKMASSINAPAPGGRKIAKEGRKIVENDQVVHDGPKKVFSTRKKSSPKEKNDSPMRKVVLIESYLKDLDRGQRKRFDDVEKKAKKRRKRNEKRRRKVKKRE